MNDSTKKPEPGSDEYDVEMAVKFRRQQREVQEALERDPLTISGRKVQTPSGEIEVHTNSMQTGPSEGDAYAAAITISPANAALQVKQVEREIERIKQELALQTGELDPQTAQARYYYEGRDRQNREIQLRQLEGATLPYALQVLEAAKEQEAQQPGLVERLQAEREQREAIKARAEQIADDEEAVQQAIRLVELRKNARGGLK